jgi:phosphatidylserine/phosphatidylglycerophosphate/cardiolipin synthase-like enzyme
MDGFASPAALLLIGALALLVVFLAVVIWSIRRHRDPDITIECDMPIDALMPSLAGLSFSTAMDGNSVEIFENGAYFDVLVDAIGEARRSVHFETFLWKEGRLGERVAAALAHRDQPGGVVQTPGMAAAARQRLLPVQRAALSRRRRRRATYSGERATAATLKSDRPESLP